VIIFLAGQKVVLHCTVESPLSQLVSHHPTFVIEGIVLIDSRNSWEKLEKYTISTLVQQLQLQKFSLLQTVTEH